ncbi:MAG: hypothetical protein KGO51_12970, partial [Alphaproteobacteria bacterium]|nr:hypothetical protein [Alphaproteobacteria bacterium]
MHSRLILFTGAAAALALAGCSRQGGQPPAPPATGAPIASLPLAQGAPPPAALAPPTAQLPPAPPVKVVQSEPTTRYRYIDRAYAMGQTFGDTPPDYTVDYQGERPWVWRSERGDYRIVEPTPEGDRAYYFSAGSDQPVLVRDPRYAYGYDGGALAEVYDGDGRPAPYDPEAAERAARYLARARALYAAAVNQRREAAYAEAWRARRAEVIQQQQAWADAQQHDADWRRWHDAHQAQDRARWGDERAMRQAYAARVAPQIAAAPAQAPQPLPPQYGPTPRYLRPGYAPPPQYAPPQYAPRQYAPPQYAPPVAAPPPSGPAGRAAQLAAEAARNQQLQQRQQQAAARAAQAQAQTQAEAQAQAAAQARA